MSDITIFSSGVVKYGAVNADLTSAAGLQYVQNFSIEISSQEKKLFNPVQVSAYAEKVAFYGSMCKVKFETEEVNLDLIARITGAATSTPSMGRKRVTGSKTDKPLFSRLEYEGEDSDGAPVNIILFRAYSLMAPTAFTLDDFGKLTIDFEGLPDKTVGDTLDQVYTIEIAA